MRRRFLITDWQLTHLGLEDSLSKAQDWRNVRVPHCVQLPPFGLPRQKLCEGCNTEKVRWMEDRQWVYRAEFAKPDLPAGHRLQLVFDGLDYLATVYLNHRKLADHEGMFAPLVLDITDWAKPTNTLAVVFRKPSGDRWQANQYLKSVIAWGFDFVPRLMTMGLWQPVSLQVLPDIHIRDWHITTCLEGEKRARVGLRVEFSSPVERGSLRVQLGDMSETFRLLNQSFLYAEIIIPNPRLWWPREMGEPYLHPLRFSLKDEKGRLVDSQSARVGLREISKVHCQGQNPTMTPLQFLVNGRPIFLRGMFAASFDSLPATVTKARYASCLKIFQEGRINLMRTWAFIHKPEFYELCDQMGMMVWQEFPQACCYPPRTDAFLTLLRREVEGILRRLRNHPSIIVWVGGNELYVDWSPLKGNHPEQKKAIRLVKKNFKDAPVDWKRWRSGADDYREAALRLMGELCHELDGSRPYHISSPLEWEGEQHGPWNYNLKITDHRYRHWKDFYDLWLHAKNHLYSEFSVPSMANASTLRRIFPGKQLWPINKTDPDWIQHKAFHACWDNFADNWLDLPLVEKMFGPLDSLEDTLLGSQYIQAEGTRFGIEEIRRRGRQVSGVMWCGFEPFPLAGGNALVDYYGNRKIGWSFLREAFAPIRVSLRYTTLQHTTFHGELWVTRDLTADKETFIKKVHWEIVDLSGHVFRHGTETVAQMDQPAWKICNLEWRVPKGTRFGVRVGPGNRHQNRSLENTYYFSHPDCPSPWGRATLQAIQRSLAMRKPT